MTFKTRSWKTLLLPPYPLSWITHSRRRWIPCVKTFKQPLEILKREELRLPASNHDPEIKQSYKWIQPMSSLQMMQPSLQPQEGLQSRTTQLSGSQIPNTQKLCELLNTCYCFKLLSLDSFVTLHYIANAPSYWQFYWESIEFTHSFMENWSFHNNEHSCPSRTSFHWVKIEKKTATQ